MADLTTGGVYFTEDLEAQFGGNIRLPNGYKVYTWKDHDDNYLDYDEWRASASAGMTINNISADGEIYLKSGNATTLTLDSSQNATFAGKVSVGTNILMNNNTELRWKDSSGTERTMLELDSSNNTYLGTSAGGNLYLVNGASYTTAVTIDTSQNATFVGNIVLDDASGAAPQVQWINGSDDTGAMYLNSSGKLQIVTGGSLRQEISSGSTEFTGNAMPSADSTYDLGTTSYYWANAYIDVITTTGNITIGGTLASSDITVTSSGGSTYFANFLPSTGSAYAKFYQDSNNHLSLYMANTSGTANVVLNSSGVSYIKGGNLIIGGSSDSGELLQVEGTAAFAGNVSITAGSLSITGDGSNAATLTESSDGEFKIASVTDLTLDAGGGDIILSDDATIFGTFSKSGNDLQLRSRISDGDLILRGVDDGSTIDALTLDMSENGAATFVGTIASGNINISDGTPVLTLTDTSSSATVTHTLDGVDYQIANNGSSGNFKLSRKVSTTERVFLHAHDNGNLILYGNGSTAQTISGANTTFAGTLTIPSYIYHTSDPSDDTYFGFSGNDTFVVYTAGGNGLNIDSNRDVTITGELYGPNGTKAIPTYSFTSDTDTGIYLEGTGNMALTAGGSATLTLESTAVTAKTNIVLDAADIQLDTAVSAATSSGTIIKFGSTTSMSAGQVVYGANSMGSLTWTATDADTGTKNILGLALGTSPTSDGILLNGIYHSASHGFTVGLPLYISTTGGEMTTTAPSGSGDYVRVVGYAIDANHIYFCPDNTWVEIA